ncbi:hypothetical protein ACFL6I_19970 [candidate division KSB1 bacterium]
MAEFLDQDAIDDLLNTSIDVDSETTKTDTANEQRKNSSLVTKRIFKPSFRPKMRFDYNYRSPVIKREDLLIDPEQINEEAKTKSVVWTLRNYNSARRKKKY